MSSCSYKVSRPRTIWTPTRKSGTGTWWYREGTYYHPKGIAYIYHGSGGQMVCFVWKGREYQRRWRDPVITDSGMSRRANSFIKEVTAPTN